MTIGGRKIGGWKQGGDLVTVYIRGTNLVWEVRPADPGGRFRPPTQTPQKVEEFLSKGPPPGMTPKEDLLLRIRKRVESKDRS